MSGHNVVKVSFLLRRGGQQFTRTKHQAPSPPPPQIQGSWSLLEFREEKGKFLEDEF
jgi:hypothetical protein